MHLHTMRLQVADVFHLLWSFDKRKQCNLVFSSQLLNPKVRHQLVAAQWRIGKACRRVQNLHLSVVFDPIRISNSSQVNYFLKIIPSSLCSRSNIACNTSTNRSFETVISLLGTNSVEKCGLISPTSWSTDTPLTFLR